MEKVPFFNISYATMQLPFQITFFINALLNMPKYESQVLVHRSIIDKVEDVLRKKTLNMKIGDPLDVTTKVGAHVSAEHRDKVQQYVRGIRQFFINL